MTNFLICKNTLLVPISRKVHCMLGEESMSKKFRYTYYLTSKRLNKN
jgi:hypothetical protein